MPARTLPRPGVRSGVAVLAGAAAALAGCSVAPAATPVAAPAAATVPASAPATSGTSQAAAARSAAARVTAPMRVAAPARRPAVRIATSGTRPVATPTPMPRGAVVVGRSTAASCTPAALERAVRRVVARGSGTVSFACGPRPVRITLSRPLAFTGTATSRYTLDGRRMVTLDGANRTGLVHLPNVQGLSATFRNLSFVRARAAHQGAAIHGGWRNRLLVENCSFTGNTATSVRQGAFDGGGALFVHEGRATVRRSTFVGNTALNGGAIQNSIGDLVVERSTFRRNRAMVSGRLGGGGALASDSGSLLVRFSSISGNTAGAGGGLFVWNAKGKVSRIQDSVVSANTATGRRDSGFGGGIRNGSGPLVIERVTLSRNVAGLQGGGLYNADDAAVRVLRTRFLGNRAGSGGGAIFRVSGTITTTRCTFRGNTPGDQR